MKLVKKENTVTAFQHGVKPKKKRKHWCGDDAGYGANPSGSDNSKANFDKNYSAPCHN